MLYPINNFLPKQFGQFGSALFRGSTKYQYGTATRGVAAIRTPNAAAFPAVAPFYWFRLTDNQGRSKEFEFRPDIAPDSSPSQVPSVPGRQVIAVQGLATGALVAAQIALAVNLQSLLTAQVNATGNFPGRLGIVAHQNTAQAVDDEVMFTMLQPGRGGIAFYTGPPVPPATFNTFGSFFGGAGGLLSGRTHASGMIVAVAGASLVDNTDTFTIEGLAGGPNVNPTPITFTFDSNGAVPAGTVLVDFSGGPSAIVMAQRIAAAINNPGAPPAGPNTTPGFWRVTASIDPVAPTVVLLRYDFPGSLAGSIISPSFITDTVASAGFIAGGMVGGQFGSQMAPLRWGLSRAAVPVAPGPDQEQVG